MSSDATLPKPPHPLRVMSALRGRGHSDVAIPRLDELSAAGVSRHALAYQVAEAALECTKRSGRVVPAAEVGEARRAEAVGWLKGLQMVMRVGSARPPERIGDVLHSDAEAFDEVIAEVGALVAESDDFWMPIWGRTVAPLVAYHRLTAVQQRRSDMGSALAELRAEALHAAYEQRRPDGRRWSYRALSTETGLSPQRISQLVQAAGPRGRGWPGTE